MKCLQWLTYHRTHCIVFLTQIISEKIKLVITYGCEFRHITKWVYNFDSITQIYYFGFFVMIKKKKPGLIWSKGKIKMKNLIKNWRVKFFFFWTFQYYESITDYYLKLNFKNPIIIFIDLKKIEHISLKILELLNHISKFFFSFCLQLIIPFICFILKRLFQR